MLTTAAITKGGPLVRGRDLLRRWCLVLLEDEAGSLADVVDLSALCRRASPTVVDSSRILDFRQTTARRGDTRAGLRRDLLRWLLSVEAVEVVLKLSHELRIVVLLLPQVAPALGEDIALLKLLLNLGKYIVSFYTGK